MEMQLAANPRVVPRNFHMHAVVQELSGGSTDGLQSLVAAVTSPFCASLQQYHADSDAAAAAAATAIATHATGSTPPRRKAWSWRGSIDGRDPFTESVVLYPSLSGKGVSVCSCSS
jgi:hypothetical protein